MSINVEHVIYRVEGNAAEIVVAVYRTSIPKGIVRTAIWCNGCRQKVCMHTKGYNEMFAGDNASR